MNNNVELLLADARTLLCKQVDQTVGSSDLLHAFAAWGLPQRREQWRLRAVSELAIANLEKSGRTYRDVAQLGYALASAIDDETARRAFSDGIDWLTGRKVKAGDSHVAFCFDVVAMLGIAVGSRAANDTALQERVSKWFGTFVPEVLTKFTGRPWEQYVLACLSSLVKPQARPQLPEADDSNADVELVLRNTISSDSPIDVALQSEAMRRVKQTESEEDERAVFLLAALDFVSNLPVTIDLQRPSIAQVAQMLAQTSAALRRWTWEYAPKTRNSGAQKWDVENEYHVQNLLYAILAPVFTDLVDEEWMPAVGQKNPRIDIGIPSLKLIVEAKFLRPGVSFSNLIGELAEDASLYRARSGGGRYAYVMPFVWDDSRRTEEHAKFLQGLGQIEGIVHPVIVARPGHMT